MVWKTEVCLKHLFTYFSQFISHRSQGVEGCVYLCHAPAWSWGLPGWMSVLRSRGLLSVFCDDLSYWKQQYMLYGLGSVMECQTVQLIAQAGVWSVPHKKLFGHWEQDCAMVWLKLSLFSGCGKANGTSSLTDFPKSFPLLPNAKQGFLLVCDGRKVTLSHLIEGNGTTLHKCTSDGVQKEDWRKLKWKEHRVINSNPSYHWQRCTYFHARKGDGETTPCPLLDLPC